MAQEAWALARSQYYVITRKQLLATGYSSEAIDRQIFHEPDHVKTIVAQVAQRLAQ